MAGGVITTEVRVVAATRRQVGVSRPRDHTRIGWARTGPQRSDLTSPQYVRALKHCRMVMHGEWGMGGFFCQARARCGVTLSRLAHDPRHRDPVGLSGRCDLTAGLVASRVVARACRDQEGSGAQALLSA